MQWSWSHISSLLVGTAIAFKDGYFHVVLLFWTWLGIELIHAATCMTNDYWDYHTGADDVSEHTIFNAGSRVIQEGKISPHLLVATSYVCYALGASIGVGLAVARGWPIFAVGMLGGLLGYFYTTPPVKLCYRGLDQLALAMCYGPLTIVGSYYVQARRVTPEVLLISLVYAITASMILYIKGFQDTEADKKAQKDSVVIKLGRRRAASLFLWFYATALLTLAVGIYFKIIPLWMLLAAGLAPLALSAHIALRKHLEDGNVTTFMRLLLRTKSAHLYLGFLLIIGYMSMRIFGR